MPARDELLIDLINRTEMEGAGPRLTVVAHGVVLTGRLTTHRTWATSVAGLLDDDSAPVSPSSALPDLIDLIRDGLILVRTTVPTDRGRIPHIALADGRHVRVEAEKASRGATTVFGDRELGSSAQQLFDTLWDRALPVARDRLSVA